MIMQIAAAFLVSLVATLIFGAFLIPALRRANAGQTIREDGPVWHNKKQGTPTMGGAMFIVGIGLACIIVGYRSIADGDLTHVYIFLFALIYAAIGFLDDYRKVKKKQNLGLKASQKFALQLIAAIVFVLIMQVSGKLKAELFIPFVNVSIILPVPLYYIFAAFVAVGTVNSVNITDGVDGLATGVTVPVAAFFVVVSLKWGFSSVSVFASALTGGLLAFLFYNFHPAKVIMGDTGSLFLGGAICAMAFAHNIPLVLIPLGIVYFIETLSDIIQVSYFKLTHGKRVFKMAPIHHHFELCGWSEYKLFAVFTAVSTLFAIISFYGVRFLGEGMF